MNEYTTIVGMEIHVELKTKSKMFCGCKNDPFFAKQPNIYTCPVCLGLPGALPVPNRKAVEWTLLLGLALGCEIPLVSKFDRKNYFYPDLPKGYQISQYDQPFCINGKISTEFGDIGIHRVHLEEDTAKLLHTTIAGKKVTLIDFNRSGIPLVEVVTEPDIRSADQAKMFLKKLQQIIRYLDISDADMEKGSMRLEPNISIVKYQVSSVKCQEKIQLPNYKVEVKNINSFSFVKKAIDYETARQIEILERGEVPIQETRSWKEDKGMTVSQRIKETADDYRYFPEPDIPPLRWSKEYIERLHQSIPELPDAKRLRFSKTYSLNEYDSDILTDSRGISDYFEEAVRVAEKTTGDISSKTIANWIINRKINSDEVLPAELVKRIVKATQVSTIDESELKKVIMGVIKSNPKAVSDYKSGKTQVMMFLMGITMKKIGQKVDVNLLMKLIKARISKNE